MNPLGEERGRNSGIVIGVVGAPDLKVSLNPASNC